MRGFGGKPRGHLLLKDGGANGAGLRADLGVGNQREWSDFTGAVAGLAVSLEDGLNVAVEGWRGGRESSRRECERECRSGSVGRPGVRART